MFQKVLSYAGQHRRTTYASILVLVAGVTMSVLPYFFLYRILRPLLTGGGLTLEETLLNTGAMALCMVLYGLLYVEGLALSHRSAYHTLENLRFHLQSKLEKQPLGAIQEKGVGVWKKMFIDDIESMELLLAHALPEGVSNLSVPVVVFVAMFLTDWKLGLLSLCSLPLGVLAMGMMYRSGMSKMGAYYAAGQKMNNTIVEYINGMEVVKVFNRDGESYHRFETDVKNYRDFTLDWFRACWLWMALYTSILPCVALVLLPAGGYLVLTGASTLPDYALVLCMSFAVGPPLVRAMSFMSVMPQLSYKIDQMEALFNIPPLQEGKQPFSGSNLDIRFEHVRFSYKAAPAESGKEGGPDLEKDEALHGVSFSVPQGSLTALVGESGSGKSTLAKLLVHFYDVTDGRITLGGQDLRDITLASLNEQISFVAQEQFLFNTTLLENIRLGKPGATDAEVLAAAERAQCGEFLGRQEKGIHTMAGDGGKQLSGGERQRIALARAILKDAPIVVLDEATAFLDPENEEKMNAAIAEVIRGKTVIVIAHRLQSIVGADQIVVLEQGQVAGIGRHEELRKTCPAYETLWRAAEGSAAWHVSAGKGGEKA